MRLFVAFVSIIVLPVLAYYTGIATSLSTGTAAVAALLILGGVEYLVDQDWSHRVSRVQHRFAPSVLALCIIALVLAHAAVVLTWQPFDGVHFLGSLAPLLLMIVAGCCLANLLQNAADRQVELVIRCCFAFFCLCAVGGLLGLSPPSARPTPKPVFPFNEPSHLAIIFTPFLIFCCVRSRGVARYGVWAIGLVLAASLQNLTLVAGCGLAALAFVRGIAIVPILLLAGGFGLLVDLSYYLGRVDLSTDNPNLSALAYLQGWQLIVESMQRSAGWGVGFQQLGLHGTDVPAAQLIFEQIQDSENLTDGAFTFAKLVSEFGVFGLGLTFFFLRFWWRTMQRLRQIAKGAAADPAELFAMSVIAGYFIELFVRGAGYFTGSGLMLVAAIWLLTAHEKKVADPRGAETGVQLRPSL